MKDTIAPRRKLEVFISSRMEKDDGQHARYTKIRREVKELIEETGLANVYVFEEESGSIRITEEHYLTSLKNSDICIFFIDNSDDIGIDSGVQKEIDLAKKLNKKSLYIFCHETSNEVIQIEKDAKGYQKSKCKIIQKFDEFPKEAAKALIQDIVEIVRRYCRDSFSLL